MLAVSASGAAVLYRKRWLGEEESIRFSPGDEPTVLEVDGWRIGVGICKDTGVPEHVERLAELEIDAYCAGLVHLPEELEQQEDRALSIALRCQAFVAFASFAGPTGGGYTRDCRIIRHLVTDGRGSRSGRCAGRRGRLGHARVCLTRKLRKELLARQPEGAGTTLGKRSHPRK